MTTWTGRATPSPMTNSRPPFSTCYRSGSAHPLYSARVVHGNCGAVHEVHGQMLPAPYLPSNSVLSRSICYHGDKEWDGQRACRPASLISQVGSIHNHLQESRAQGLTPLTSSHLTVTNTTGPTLDPSIAPLPLLLSKTLPIPPSFWSPHDLFLYQTQTQTH